MPMDAYEFLYYALIGLGCWVAYKTVAAFVKGVLKGFRDGRVYAKKGVDPSIDQP